MALMCELFHVERRKTRRLWSRLALLGLSLACAASGNWAQEVHYFSLAREGTAAVVVSRNTRTAWVLDGGRQGSLKGEKLILEGMELLPYLKLNSDTVVISCSHPHSDHLDGLKDVVSHRSKAPNDVDLTSFERVVFVDSGYPAKVSLKALFESTHPGTTTAVENFSATNKDVFSEAVTKPLQPGIVPNARVENFVYEPDENARVHGRAIVTHTLLTRDSSSETTLLVDFDDADSKLVKRWATWAEKNLPSATHRVYVAPHHNSDGTDISPLLQPALLPEAVIVTANPGNRFRHPGPKNWVRWIKALKGVQHIHVTGAGDGLTVTAAGLKSADDGERERMANLIVLPGMDRVERELRKQEEAWFADVDASQMIRKCGRAGLDRAGLAARMGVTLWTIRSWEHRVLPVPAEKRTELLRLLQAEPITGKTRILREELVALREVKSALLGVEAPIVERPGDNKKVFVSSGADSPRSGPDDSSVGSYLERTKKFEERRGANKLMTRADRFARSTTGEPIFGGIVFGNDCSAPGLKPLQSRLVEGEEGNFILKVQLAGEGTRGGSWVTYSDFTPMELWSAYHIIMPRESWLRDYEVSQHECNLVGKGGNYSHGWLFAVHPAIANTLVARDLMALDMLPAYWWKSHSGLPKFDSYRWFDRPSTIHLSADGTIEVISAENVDQSLLRFKLWRMSEKSRRLAELQREFEHLSKQIRIMEEQQKPSPGGIESPLGKGTLFLNPYMVSGVLSGRAVLMSEKMNLASLLDDITALEKENDPNDQGEDVEFDETETVKEMQLQLMLVRRVDRFVRTLAVLHWLGDAKPPALPVSLPPDLEPSWLSIGAELSFQQFRQVIDESAPAFEAQEPWYTQWPARGTSFVSFLLDYWAGRGSILILITVCWACWLRLRRRRVAV